MRRGLSVRKVKLVNWTGFKTPPSSSRETHPGNPRRRFFLPLDSFFRRPFPPLLSSGDSSSASPSTHCKPPTSSSKPDERTAAKQRSCCQISSTVDHCLFLLAPTSDSLDPGGHLWAFITGGNRFGSTGVPAVFLQLAAFSESAGLTACFSGHLLCCSDDSTTPSSS